MKKKVLALVLCLALAVTAITGASLAYFTDTDAAENTFTSGNVKIKLVEQQRGEGDTLVDFEQGKNLVPYTGKEGTKDLAKNYVDKIVNVKNRGTEPAYVRVLVAVPAELKDALHIDWNTAAWTQKTAEQVTINDTLHDVYVMTYNTVLAKKTVTENQAMYGMYLDPAVDYKENVGYTFKGEKLNINLSSLTIPVFAQAIQAQGFDSADAAFAASGFTTNPWAK